jgi:hypothetical protein
MVLFFSKSNIVTVAILVSSLSINVIAAPGKFEVVHGNSTIDGSVVLPPILKSRCTIPGDIYRPVNVSTEADIIEKNNQWMKKHQKGSDKSKREAETVGGMTLELPETVPPLSTPSVSTVVTATTAQVTTFKKYAEIASTAYCRSVVPSNNWDCKHCLTSVPDGKLLKTFSSLISDTNGFVLRSDKDKAIYLVFRGTNSIRSAIVVSVQTLFFKFLSIITN